MVDSVVSDIVGEVTGDEPAEGRVLDQALAQEFKWADDEVRFSGRHAQHRATMVRSLRSRAF